MVLYVSPAFDWRIHDKKMADTAYSIPPPVLRWNRIVAIRDTVRKALQLFSRRKSLREKN
jgi:hypothetical protein